MFIHSINSEDDTKILFLRLEVDLCLDEVFGKLAPFNGKRFLGIQLPVQNQIAHFDSRHSNPVRVRRFVRVEEFEFQYCVRRDWFACLAILVELWIKWE